MEQLFANRSISATELKRSLTSAIKQAGLESVAVLNHNRPAAYWVLAATYQNMLAQLQVQQWRSAVEVSRAGPRPDVSGEDAFAAVEKAIAATQHESRAKTATA
jgi:antitoxin StbD